MMGAPDDGFDPGCSHLRVAMFHFLSDDGPAAPHETHAEKQDAMAALFKTRLYDVVAVLQFAAKYGAWDDMKIMSACAAFTHGSRPLSLVLRRRFLDQFFDAYSKTRALRIMDLLLDRLNVMG
jgi:hypothetical protein